MTFVSFVFFVFFIVVLLLLKLVNILEENGKIIRGKDIQHYILVFASYIFYGWWDWRFCGLMLIITTIAFITAKRIEKNKKDKFALVIGVVFPLIILGFFKYFNFFLGSFSELFGIENLGTLNIILPIGISFYTFHALSYILDVHRGKAKATDKFMDLALYIAFFPQLVAGPIIKANDFMPQLDEGKNISTKSFLEGMQIFVFGLAKKVVIADHLSLFVDDVFKNPNAYHSFTIILAVVAYSIQIYFDFSGYSDMAVGCAKCLGYRIPRNFNVPYISKNLTEFWKRWHISLSTWLQEYLYISLGGNRKGEIRTYINLLVTMLLGGLWHGARWNFVIWGFLHGIALCVHKLYLRIRKPSAGENAIVPIISVAATYGYVCICWVFFRAATLQDSLVIINRIFIWQEGIIQPYSWSFIAIVIICIATVYAYMNGWKINKDSAGKRKIGIAEGYYPVMDLAKFASLVIFILVIGIIFGLAYTASNPFIYFQF